MKELLNKLSKKYPKSLTLANETKKINKIPTGVFSLDLVTQGGIPLNKFTVLWGNKSSGKTTLSFKIMDSFLTRFKDHYVVYVDFEHALNKEWMSKFVSDMSRVVVVHPDYGEQGVDLTHSLSQEEGVSLIVIDSLSSIISITEVEESSEDSQVASSSRLIRKLLNKLLVSMSVVGREGKPLTTVLVSQVRSNIGARRYESKIKMPGGYIVQHFAYLILHLYLIKYVSKDDTPVKAVHNFAIEKNKCGLPKLGGEFVINLLDGRVEDEDIILSYAKKFELLGKNGKKYVLCNEESPTLSGFKEMLKEVSFRDKVVEEISKRWWNHD